MTPRRSEVRSVARVQHSRQEAEGSAGAAGWLGLVFALIVVVALSVYLVRAGRYHGSGFTEVVAWPTLAAALGFLVQQIIGVWKRMALLGETRSGGLVGHAPGDHLRGEEASRVVQPSRGGVQPKGFFVAACLAVGYVALLTSLGFVIDSLVLVALGPIACGQPLRRMPVVAVVGLVLVGVLAEVVRLSGVVPLPGGMFHIGVPW